MTGSERRSVVVLIQAWDDDDGVRGWVTFEAGQGDEIEVERVPVRSLEDLCATACDALWSWAARR